MLLNALAAINAKHLRQGHQISSTVASLLDKNESLREQYSRPDATFDKLYEPSWLGTDQLVTRGERHPSKDDPTIHYGLIASANQLMKDRKARDALIAKHDVLCFEMEAAGLMNSFPCLAIRGICDYSDSYKNDMWQGYAAAVAAAYAKALLQIIPGNDVQSMQSVEEATKKEC